MPVTYEEFADSRLGALLRYAVMLTGDQHTAQDLVQETMVRVQLNWRRVAASDSPDGYVRKMLTNQFIDLRRGSWLRRVLLRAEPDPVRAVLFDHADETAERDRVWGMLARLPRRQRAARHEALTPAVGPVRAGIEVASVRARRRRMIRRADTVMIIHVPAARTRAYLVSLPRDGEVKLPGGARSKLSETLLAGGPELTEKAVSELTGVTFDATVTVDFRALRAVK